MFFGIYPDHFMSGKLKALQGYKKYFYLCAVNTKNKT